MLVLSRRATETVEFPALGIRIEVLRCSSKSVRVGIDAPRDIQVLRGELADDQPATAHRHFHTILPAKPEWDRMSDQLQMQIREAATTLNQLQALSQSEHRDANDAAIEDLVDQLRTIDTCASQLVRQNPEPRRVHTLLVDDNRNEARLLASYLKIKGMEVTLAHDGQEAISKLSTTQPDVVLLDMTMPQYDGSWTIDQIRSRSEYDNLTVFAVSGIGESESNVQVGPSGVNAWFRKPLNPEQLAGEIHRKCGKTFVA